MWTVLKYKKISYDDGIMKYIKLNINFFNRGQCVEYLDYIIITVNKRHESLTEYCYDIGNCYVYLISKSDLISIDFSAINDFSAELNIRDQEGVIKFGDSGGFNKVITDDSTCMLSMIIDREKSNDKNI